VVLGAIVLVLLASGRIASFLIDYQWWREVGQVETWVSMLFYRVAPTVAAAVVMFVALWLAHGRGLHFSGVRPERGGWYSKAVPVALALLALLLAGSLDFWVVMSYAGSRGINVPADAWKDPVFGRPLPFYLFDLPFYSEVLGLVFGLAILCVLVFWATARGWQLADRFRRWRRSGGLPEQFELEPGALLLPGATSAGFVRVMAALVLLGFGVWVLLGNYKLLLNHHAFLTGADYVDEKVTLPLRYLLAVAALIGMPLVWTRRWTAAVVAIVAAYVLHLVAPGIVRAVYVRPNEISIERPYIERHIEATRSAFGLNRRATERVFSASTREAVDATQHATLLENIRLWDWRAYSDTITQIQALRPYYTFPDTDVDRYQIHGRIKQVLLSPRELDVRQLPADARQSWVNPHLVYTHGFGVVVSEVNKTTPDGLPALLIENAPPEIKSAGFTLTRPELYYGESTHDLVFVNTLQEEFDYPSGEQNKYSKYQGSGGFPVGSFWVQAAAALHFGEPNILFTRYFTPQSRLMIHRNVSRRLAHLAGFLHWDADPYLVIADDGKLVWMVDGYATSRAHPYSAVLPVLGLGGGANYIRNAVKATVDAYNGKMTLYIFDPEDPIIQAYQRLFPTLFRPASEMPTDLRRHARYPEVLFRTQAEAYRTFHMRDPQVFYNKEDVWEIARSLFGQSGKPEPMQSTYVVATLPGEKEPEFLLMLPFAPRGKDNLIGWMAARCDGDRLGELIFYQLSKQQLIYGPMQIESRIDSDQNISKDLSLWNQQGSRVLRGNIIALPVGEAFLYVESIYIQAVEARMPQLKKVVLAMGNRLIYRDTFEQALAELTSGAAAAPARAEPTAAPAPSRPAEQVPVLTERLRRLRDQAQQLVREIEAIEKEAVRR
jgi:hypothetical protein